MSESRKKGRKKWKTLLVLEIVKSIQQNGLVQKIAFVIIFQHFIVLKQSRFKKQTNGNLKDQNNPENTYYLQKLNLWEDKCL